ncbi:MAG: phosphoribosylformimino-5-aminoimidazole carboxamide ribotide isomerase [Deltaproteobacteria bacterium]|nr:phosphoribosylformimino-5-aminoimidazole carboxamide ribotide isomerase [Deltaproteobacteria bacterium]
MKFRPCIDLHKGQVKQIVGSTLSDSPSGPITNFSSEKPASYYAGLYRDDNLTGGHIIKLGPGCDGAALSALHRYPGGMQIGGGITSANALFWLEQGASAVIVTSFIFQDGKIFAHRLKELAKLVGKEHLVIDLSCRKRGDDYFVVTDRWQKFTEITINKENLAYFSRFCLEFLIHAVDVEGKCCGIEEELAAFLAENSPIPTTYAGGVKNMADLYHLGEIGLNRLDVTIGSALDIFGGSGVTYRQAVEFNRGG